MGAVNNYVNYFLYVKPELAPKQLQKANIIYVNDKHKRSPARIDKNDVNMNSESDNNKNSITIADSSASSSMLGIGGPPLESTPNTNPLSSLSNTNAVVLDDWVETIDLEIDNWIREVVRYERECQDF